MAFVWPKCCAMLSDTETCSCSLHLQSQCSSIIANSDQFSGHSCLHCRVAVVMKCNCGSNTELLRMVRFVGLRSFSMAIVYFSLPFEAAAASNEGHGFTFCVLLSDAFSMVEMDQSECCFLPIQRW